MIETALDFKTTLDSRYAQVELGVRVIRGEQDQEARR
jgi:hypothetical protein